MSQILAHHSKSASRNTRKKWDQNWDTATVEGCQFVASIMDHDAKALARVAPDESRARAAMARTLRGQPRLTGTVIPIIRICRRARQTPRARHTQTAKATSDGADSGGDPEPPRRPPLHIYSLPRVVLGGAL